MTPRELAKGSYKEMVRENYVEGEKVSFACNKAYRAEPRDPKSSDVRDGLITCGRDGWLAAHTCISSNINAAFYVKCSLLLICEDGCCILC